MGLDQKLYTCCDYDITEKEINENIGKFIPAEFTCYEWDDEPNISSYIEEYYNNKYGLKNFKCIENGYSVELDKHILNDILYIASSMLLDMIDKNEDKRKIRNYSFFIHRLSEYISLIDNHKVFYRATI